MKHLIISYKSRNSLYMFAKILKANGVFYSIVNTPRSIATSCGLSLKTEHRYYNLINALIKKVNFDSFVGVFAEIRINNQLEYQRLF